MRTDFSLGSCPIPPIPAAFSSLHADERELLGEKATPKRIADFTAGRIAAKRAVHSCLALPESEHVSILRVEAGPEAGKPYVKAGNMCTEPMTETLHISISHADRMAYAVASHLRIGIDHVTIEPYSDAFSNDVFAKYELEEWANWLGVGPQDELVACAGFAAKEAVLKYVGTGLRYSLPQITVVPVFHKQTSDPHPFFQRRFRAALQLGSSRGELDGYFAIKDGQVIVMVIGEKTEY
ncbi:MAG: 4'-phosphopantetheinyl transferase family protein [Clostridia bacterium]